MRKNTKPWAVEWPTLGLIFVCYLFWYLILSNADQLTLFAAIPLMALVLTFHSSLQHEVSHGHPFRSRALSEALVFPAIGLCVPLHRFRDLHLAHHKETRLTDPYDDPESFYLDPAVWERLPRWYQRLLRINNTLLGRILLGPAIGQIVFMAADWRMIRAGDRAALMGWLWHIPALSIALWLILTLGTMPLWAYALSAYFALSVLKIRTFLEHQAHERASGRSVIIEDRGPLGFLFLNNNLHALHHAHPKLPWYQYWQVYRAKRDHLLWRNRGYFYRSYWEVAKRHLFKAKEPVPHPLWRRE